MKLLPLGVLLCSLTSLAFAAADPDCMDARELKGIVDAMPNNKKEIEKFSQALQSLIEVHSSISAAANIQLSLVVCRAREANAIAIYDHKLIAVTSGLLSVTGADKDMLAAVIGHEVAHFVRNHKAYYESAEAKFVAYGNATAQSVFDHTWDESKANEIGLKTFLRYRQAFKREQEADADDYGVQLLSKAGFKPDGMRFFILRMIAIDGAEATGWLADHPSWPDRLVRIEPRVTDENFVQATQALSNDRQQRLAKIINVWLKRLPNSGNGWYQKALFLEYFKRSESVEALENALSGEGPRISLNGGEVGKVWLALCVKLFWGDFKTESAWCSSHITDPELKAEFEHQTFTGLLIVGGTEPKTDGLLIGRTKSGTKIITNDSFVLKGGDIPYMPMPKAWQGMRFPPKASNLPLSER